MSWVPVVLTRRKVFVVSGMTLAGACAAPDRRGDPAAPGPEQGSATAPADEIRTRALSAETELIARYDAALALPAVAADGALSAKLTAIRAEHAAHAAAIGGAGGASATPPSAAATDAADTTDAKTTVAALIKAEQNASGARTADILAADGATAMLLASVAAAESGHAALLLGGAA